MNRYLRLSITAVVCSLLLASFTFAQGQPVPFAQGQPTNLAPPSLAPPSGGLTVPATPASSIKLVIVLARYDGDKKISSLPYTLLLAPGESGNIRAGAEVAVPTTIVGGPVPSYSLQQVGSQIEARATPTSDGKFKLNLTVTDRSIITGAPATQGGVPNVPSFRNNTTASTAILSNGETVQFTSSSDKASNETFRVDVTLTVGNK